MNLYHLETCLQRAPGRLAETLDQRRESRISMSACGAGSPARKGTALGATVCHPPSILRNHAAAFPGRRVLRLAPGVRQLDAGTAPWLR